MVLRYRPINETTDQSQASNIQIGDSFFKERMPFMSISVPESVRSYKSWRDNLRRNQDKMVSQFDVHQTMLHFMTSNVTTRDKDHERLPLSLLDSVIPDNRTCRQVTKKIF